MRFQCIHFEFELQEIKILLLIFFHNFYEAQRKEKI